MMAFLNSGELEIEKKQLKDEGKGYKGLMTEIDRLINLYEAENFERYGILLSKLYRKIIEVPEKKNYKFREFSDFRSIEREIPGKWNKEKKLSEKEIEDRIYGAWFGRCAGCLLGKPFEGKTLKEISEYLRQTDQYPLKFYLTGNRANSKLIEKYRMNKNLFVGNINSMPEDDDLNYTTSHLLIYEKYNGDFCSRNIADFYISHIPYGKTFTAERVAYRNLLNGIKPPESGIYFNPYREWIGAQIRGDFSGYINIGNPSRAIKMAWEDAIITHIKNGIYGEIWVAVLISMAPFFNNPLSLVENSLNFIPVKSRLRKELEEILSLYKRGIKYEDVVENLHEKWNEKDSHHWCHVISNAKIVCIGLLWGEDDFVNSVTKAVMCGFDTDCNGATVGSVIGIKNGFKKIPSRWISVFNDIISTGISGYSKLKISDLASRTLKIFYKKRKEGL